ncbi:pollen-specific leucine-rich repeat extensin-like protein 4 [Iris pallida]|uniref:Pollen-specific leucine-rich repeat extensin-like protein 4 n=1 Tax=Iris pallida TaxID=29817 RepID=A0AAX6I4Z7_IRIPA|nr:pollen-specific leucine-rich repeat extensin-like protein 4 [Iris pallida]
MCKNFVLSLKYKYYNCCNKFRNVNEQ